MVYRIARDWRWLPTVVLGLISSGCEGGFCAYGVCDLAEDSGSGAEPGGTSETTGEMSETTSGTEESEPTQTQTETPSTADAEATGGMSSLEGGLSEAGVDAGDGSVPEAGVADGGDAGQSSTDPTDTTPLACTDNFDCNPPRPVCLDSRCIACIDDETDYGCLSAAAPRCKSGPTLDTNQCVQCLSALDCDGANLACQANQCVPCSIVDHQGCSPDAPFCLPRDPITQNLCVQCLDDTHCSDDTPVCESNTCIPCSAADDEGCDEPPASRCLAATTPDLNQCVECLDPTDCGPDRPFCVTNACLECTTNTQCTDTAEPRCDDTGTCAGCETSDHCGHLPATPNCDLATGSCEQCTQNSHCSSDSASLCTTQNECGACVLDADCSHIPGKGVCNQGTCVQCTPQNESACNPNSCNPATLTCTSTPRNTRRTCESCLADSECIQGGIGEGATMRCVPMTYQDSPRPGGFCLLRLTSSCSRPFTVPFSATSLSGTPAQQYCGIQQDDAADSPNTAITCEAVRDLLDDVSCTSDAQCGNGLGGRCRTVGGVPNKCTYSCGTTAECPNSRNCDAPTTPHCH